MIKVTVDRTEYDEDTLEVLSIAHETYTGEYARKWLKEHPEVYDDNKIYKNNVDEHLYMPAMTLLGNTKDKPRKFIGVYNPSNT